jgi:hypothetical protein
MDILTIDVDFVVNEQDDLDEGNLRYLKNICEQAKKFNPKICYGKTHDEILKHIGGQDAMVLNIDQHHDVYYPNQDGFDTLLNVAPKESTWVKYLELKGQLKGYIWIKNKHSIVDGLNALWLRPMVMHKEDFPKLPKIDMVFVCESPKYLPKHLLNTFEDIYGTLCSN